MSLLCDASGEFINHGAGVSIANLSSFTVAYWYYPTSLAAGFRSHWYKQDAGGNGRSAYSDAGSIGAYIKRATNYDERVSNPVLIESAWNFVATTYDLVNLLRFYHGTQFRLATEVTYAITDQIGSGGASDESGLTLYVGSNADGDMPIMGKIAFFTYIPVSLNLGQIRDVQLRLTESSATQTARILCEYGYESGTATQTDWSGYGNHGTVTGATIDSHLPRWYPLLNRAAMELGAAGATSLLFHPNPMRHMLVR